MPLFVLSVPVIVPLCFGCISFIKLDNIAADVCLFDPVMFPFPVFTLTASCPPAGTLTRATNTAERLLSVADQAKTPIRVAQMTYTRASSDFR